MKNKDLGLSKLLQECEAQTTYPIWKSLDPEPITLKGCLEVYRLLVEEKTKDGSNG